MAALKVDDLGRVVTVEYDYKYKANDGRNVSIKEGEQYILIKKSNADWWQVIKLEQKKPLYIPAAYVKEQSQKTFPDHPYFRKAYKALQKANRKPAECKEQLTGNSDSGSEQSTSTSKERTIFVTKSREDINVLSLIGDQSKYSTMRASCDSLDRFIENENPYDEVPFQLELNKNRKEKESSLAHHPDSDHRDPEYENIEVLRKSIEADHKRSGACTADSDARLPCTETFKPFPRRRSSNFTGRNEHLPASSGEHRCDSWECQSDSQTGTIYYYNSMSGEMRVNVPSLSATAQGLRSSETSTANVTSTSFRPEVIPTTSRPDLTSTSPRPEVASKSPRPEVTSTSSKPEVASTSPRPEVTSTSSPPPVPDPSKKPTFDRNRLSPDIESPKRVSLQRRRTSPARYKEKQQHDSHVTSPPAPHPTSPVNDDSAHVSPRADVKLHVTLASRRSPGSDHVTPSKRSSLSRSLSTREEAKSSCWYRDPNTDHEVVFVHHLTGERWHQMLDEQTQQFYYFNEKTRKTSWELPYNDKYVIAEEDGSESSDGDEHPLRRNCTLLSRALSASDERSGGGRKANTIERDQQLINFDNVFPEDDGAGEKNLSLPRGGSSAQSRYKPRNSGGMLVDRHLHARSMILLTDSPGQPELEHTQQMLQRQGRLNWTKLFEAGKKQRKNWIQQWVVLLANNLLFYKDQKQAAATKSLPHGRPESSCDLRGANIEWARERSSKKNVIELQTVRGLHLLLQHEDGATVGKWLAAIKSTIERANQSDPIDPTMFDPPKYNSTIDQDDEHDVDHKKKKEKKKKSKAPSRHGSDAKKEDRVRNKLKKFIGRRPTFESLKEQGIIKDSVFGCPLHNLCQKEQTTVPRFIKLCVAEVEKRGLDIDGIYRVSGNLSHVQKLRYLIDRDEAVDLSEPQWEDVHLITGALKMFLRELPEPVIPFRSFDPFIEACKIADGNERNQRMRTLVKEMPKENTDTLKFLMNHFRKVVEHSSRNRMQVQNVAIVFGPTLLLKPPDTSDPTAGGGGQMIFMVYQNEIIDTLLTQYSHIFL